MLAELLFVAAIALAIGSVAFTLLWLLWLGASHFWDWWEERREAKTYERKL